MPAEFDQLYTWGIALCAVLAVVWAFRIRARGWRAVPMLVASLAFAALLYLLRERAASGLAIAAGAVLFAMLGLDALVKTGSKREGG